jgi:hypothetical protein
MNFVERFRSDFAQEMKSTRPMIERVRGQMTVYLRLLDVPVPITYGPTADDRGSFGI